MLPGPSPVTYPCCYVILRATNFTVSFFEQVWSISSQSALALAHQQDSLAAVHKGQPALLHIRSLPDPACLYPALLSTVHSPDLCLIQALVEPLLAQTDPTIC